MPTPGIRQRNSRAWMPRQKTPSDPGRGLLLHSTTTPRPLHPSRLAVTRSSPFSVPRPAPTARIRHRLLPASAVHDFPHRAPPTNRVDEAQLIPRIGARLYCPPPRPSLGVAHGTPVRRQWSPPRRVATPSKSLNLDLVHHRRPSLPATPWPRLRSPGRGLALRRRRPPLVRFLHPLSRPLAAPVTCPY